MPIIQFKNMGEGEFFCKWMKRRLIIENKNVLSAELGPTGSGKSYRDLRKAQIWYKYQFNEDFPVENICFGVEQVMKLLASGKLRRGEVIIVEEAGVNLGSRDWQSKMSKMFNYILQSFRSMNLALFLNLPYLSMLDVQARNLLHYYAESVGIDQKEGLNECKPFFIQIAQSSGKVYRHYPKVIYEGKVVKLKRFLWKRPSQYLVDAYEGKKAEYLKNLTKEYHEKLSGREKEEYSTDKVVLAMKIKNLKERDNKSFTEIAKILGIARQTASIYYKIADTITISNKNKQNLKEMGVSVS